MVLFQVYEFAFVCCSIAAVALLVWEHIICFGDEVQRIWSRKFSGATVLYSLLRYGTLLEKIAIMVLASWYMTPHIFPYILRTIGFGLFSSLRVYALTGNRWPLALFVFSLCLPSAINPSYVYAHQWSPGVDQYGCQLAYMASQEVHERLRVSGVIGDILSETIVIIVTVTKTFGLRQSKTFVEVENRRPGIAQLLLRDGTIYFVILLIFSLADMLVLVFDHVPESTIGYDYWVVPYFTPVFRTMVICRFMLMLRAIFYDNAERVDGVDTAGSIHFVSRVAGSMGATLTPSSMEDTDVDSGVVYYAREPFAASMAMDFTSPSKGKEKECDPNINLEEFPWAAGEPISGAN